MNSWRNNLLPVSGLAIIAAGCGGDTKSLSLVEEIRVPVAQFFTETSPEEAKNLAGCETFSDTKVYCQQYPLRFGKKFLVRFVTLSKPTQKPVVTVKYLQKISLAPVGNNLVASLGSEKVPVSFLKITKEAALSTVLQEKGLRVESQVFSLEVPSLDSFLAKRDAVPAFNIQYTAEGAGSPADEGYVSFYVYPDSTDESTWSNLKVQAKQNGIDPSFLDLARKRSKTNVPPTIVTLSPSSGTKNSATKELAITLAAKDKDPDAKSRIQWFVSSGELSKQKARDTKWSKASESEVGGVFVMLRDLQGGVDFKYANYLK